MRFYQLGEVRPPRDDDFMYFKEMAQDESHWKKSHIRKKIKVFTRVTEASNIKMIKVVANLQDISADVLYDTLHDPIYRSEWDATMKEGFQICQVAQDSVIEYYGLKAPFTFKNRDFVLHRSWRKFGSEYIIFNRSVFHKKVPPKPDYVRALTYLTGYVITSTGPSSCEMIYITQNDPRGTIPAWAINLVATSVAPSIMKSLHRAASHYPAWKAQHDPQFMPWRHQSQQSGLLPAVDMTDILSEPDYARTTIDETNVDENAARQACASDDVDNDL
ncbi:putative Phosphatidylcholine transfer protein [Fasciola gigantica]|uniref:START domain-containing protein 10 n=1 Tax=Fasciola gigantica TaxID=46835 RepID=A0A504YIN5_FASGI|nr:putative Phosphatidylcholine transfer protein [Fasciola gigantica]